MSAAEPATSGQAPAPAAADRRSSRILAMAEAGRIRAQTEQVRVDTAERWKQQHASARERRAAARRAERGRSWIRRRAAARAGAHAVVRSAPSLAGAAACVAPTLIATRGQYVFGVEVMRLGALAVLVPVMLEGAAWMLAWQRFQAIAAGDPATRLTVGVWALAGSAAGLNFWHGSTGPAGSAQVGVTYGVASVVGFALVELLARHRAGVTGRVRERRARRRLALARALRFPRVSWAAWSARIAHGPAIDPDQVWRQVWAATAGAGYGTAQPGGVDAAPAAARTGRTARWSRLVGEHRGPTVLSSGKVDLAAAQPSGADDTGLAPADDAVPDELPDPAPAGDGGSVGVVGRAADARVVELADLVQAGEPVTGEQAGVIFGVSERTGRRLVAEAKTRCDRAAEPTAVVDPAAANPPDDDDDPAVTAAERRLLHFPASDSQQTGVSA